MSHSGAANFLDNLWRDLFIVQSGSRRRTCRKALPSHQTAGNPMNRKVAECRQCVERPSQSDICATTKTWSI